MKVFAGLVLLGIAMIANQVFFRQFGYFDTTLSAFLGYGVLVVAAVRLGYVLGVRSRGA